MLETIVSKEHGIRAAADGDVATLGHFVSQFRPETKAADTSPEIPAVQPRELVTTLFREAIANGQLAVVQLLLVSPLTETDMLSQLLSWAIHDDYCEIVQCLLTRGADPNTVLEDEDEDEDFFPLLLAARLGSVDIAECLLKHGASVNARRDTDGATALHEAARQDDCDMIQLLIQHGANVNAIESRNDETPLRSAAKRGHRRATAMLVQCHADVTRVNRRGSTPEHLARVEGHEALLPLLAPVNK